MSEENQAEENGQRKWQVSRRGFLIGFGATAVTATTVFALGTTIGLPKARLAVANGIDESGGSRTTNGRTSRP